MDVVTQQGYHPDSPTHPGSVKHYSRHGIADSPREVRLDALPSVKSSEPFGPLDVDLFVSRLTHLVSRFFGWRPDPLA